MSITLTGSQNVVAVVDDIDNDLANLKWSLVAPGGYRYLHRKITKVRGKREYLHRVIAGRVFGDISSKVVDHVNGDTMDNRRENLRVTDKSGNSHNSDKIHGRSRFRGVWKCQSTGRWASSIKVRGVTFWLGRFDEEEEAATAYLCARERYVSF